MWRSVDSDAATRVHACVLTTCVLIAGCVDDAASADDSDKATGGTTNDRPTVTEASTTADGETSSSSTGAGPTGTGTAAESTGGSASSNATAPTTESTGTGTGSTDSTTDATESVGSTEAASSSSSTYGTESSTSASESTTAGSTGPATGGTTGGWMDAEPWFLGHDVIDAEYSATLDRVVTVSTNPDEIHIIDPTAQSMDTLELSVPPTAVSVEPGAERAAVGHAAWASVIDLMAVVEQAVYPVDTTAADIVFGANGYIYVFPLTDQWERIRCVDPNGMVTQSTGNQIRAGTHARAHPGGTWIYGADNGISRDDIEKYDIVPGTADYLTDSPYHGDHEFMGDLWPTRDGAHIVTRSGNIYWASADPLVDMTWGGTLEGYSGDDWQGTVRVEYADSMVSTPRVLALQEGSPVEVDVFDLPFAQLQGTVPIPAFGGAEGVAYGRYVFVSGDETRVYVLVQSEGTGAFGLVNLDAAVVP